FTLLFRNIIGIGLEKQFQYGYQNKNFNKGQISQPTCRIE
ncbi:MAG: hypothetical protein ACI83W_000468, partial [Marinoscillum sp.]